MRTARILALAFSACGAAFSSAIAEQAECAQWVLDGYHLGMTGDELLAVRSVTRHVEGQAQAIEPGKFSGVLVLDAQKRLQRWDVLYDTSYGAGLRGEWKARLGEPAADVTGPLWSDESGKALQRRTIWRSTTCDIAILLHENIPGSGARASSIHATLIRASALPAGLVEMKTLH